MLKDPYVKRIWELTQDPNLYAMSSNELRQLRSELTRDCLSYFARRSDFHADLFERAGVDPASAGLKELAHLAIPSDMLRGDGQARLLIDDVDPGGETFMSSGTTNDSPVRIYRSPLDLAIMINANVSLFEYVYGNELKEGEGVALFMAAPELRDHLSFVAFVHLTLERKGIELLYGMDLDETMEGDKPWHKLRPNRKRVMQFLKSKKEPKILFSAPAGAYLMAKRFDEQSRVKTMLQKLTTGTPPIQMGRGGLVVTGGGTKGFVDLPDYETIVSDCRRHFRSKDVNGKEVETPFMDVLGMTETLTAFIDNHDTMGKTPHPLSESFLVDPSTFHPRKEGEGLLCIFNPFNPSWLECFYPGDIMTSAPSDRYYGEEFQFVRRLSIKDGWGLQRACGGSLEEMMGDDT